MYYIFHKPSYFGMGSDVDEFLVNEDEVCGPDTLGIGKDINFVAVGNGFPGSI